MENDIKLLPEPEPELPQKDVIIEENKVDKRPRLDDPSEWAIIRRIYFGGDTPPHYDRDGLDPLEQYDRMQRKAKRKLNAR